MSLFGNSFSVPKKITLSDTDKNILYSGIIGHKNDLSELKALTNVPNMDSVQIDITLIDLSCNNILSDLSETSPSIGSLLTYRNYWMSVLAQNLSNRRACGLNLCHLQLLTTTISFNNSSTMALLARSTQASWLFETGHLVQGTIVYNEISNTLINSDLFPKLGIDSEPQKKVFDNPLQCASVAEALSKLQPSSHQSSSQTGLLRQVAVDIISSQCIIQAALYRHALSSLRYSLDTVPSMHYANLFVTAKYTDVQKELTALIAVCNTLRSGKAIIPISWIASKGEVESEHQTDNISTPDLDTISLHRLYSTTFSRACESLMTGATSGILELLSQTCTSIALHSTVRDVSMSFGVRMVTVELTLDAAKSLSSALFSLGVVELATMLDRAVISSYTGVGVRCSTSLVLPDPPWAGSLDDLQHLQDSEHLSIDDCGAGSDGIDCDEAMILMLASAAGESADAVKAIYTQIIRRNSWALTYLLQRWLTICSPVVLHVPTHSGRTSDSTTSHLDSFVLLEPRLLRFMVLGQLRSLLATCVQEMDCQLAPMEEMNDGMQRGLFLLAYQGLPAGFSFVHSDWELPRLYRLLLELASPTWPRHDLFVGRLNPSEPAVQSLHKELPPSELGIDPEHEGSAAASTSVTTRILRVGFISAFFSRHSVGRLLGRVVSGLNNSLIEVHVLQVSYDEERGGRDDLTAEMKKVVERWHCLSSAAKVQDVVHRISALDLDVLVFGDVFMDSFSTHLAMTRLARVQVAFWGHPHSTGFPSIDYFVSSVLFHPVAYQRSSAQFYEQLVLFDSISTKLWETRHTSDDKIQEQMVVDELARVLEGGTSDRWTDLYGQAFNLTDAATLQCSLNKGHGRASNSSCIEEVRSRWRRYGCLQSLMKMHPIFDDAIIGQALRHRLQSKISTAVDQASGADECRSLAARIVFIDQLPTDQYLGLVCAMHVTLDPFPFGGGVTLSDSLSCHVPFVTLGSAQTVLRLGVGFAVALNATAMIADSLDDYVSRAVALASMESGLRRDVRLRLQEASWHCLYQSEEAVLEWENFLLRISSV